MPRSLGFTLRQAVSRQNKATTNNHVKDQINSLPAANSVGRPVGGGGTGVLIDVLGDLGGESTTDPNDPYAAGGGGGGLGTLLDVGGGRSAGGGGAGVGLPGIDGSSGVPEDNFNK